MTQVEKTPPSVYRELQSEAISHTGYRSRARIVTDGRHAWVDMLGGNWAVVDLQDVSRVADIVWNGSCGYAVSNRCRAAGDKRVKMHRFLVNAAVGLDVDHINGHGWDNRRSNLRECTHAQNGMNQKVSARNSTGYKGVSFCKQTGRFRATIHLEGRKCVNLGRYSTPEAAYEVYKVAARKHFGEFARLP